MSAYEPNSRHLREVLIFCFNMKKSAAEAHRMLSNTYGEAAISERTCREWFQRFKNGGVEDQHGIWWNQLGVVYYELLKPTEIITATRGLLATDHVILNHGQVTWTTPELAPPLLTTTPHQEKPGKVFLVTPVAENR
ncbi:uncharacterized protein TNCV_3750381 [Trichonephila clavipes]|nr:uncharacterized protein TNCV_3750381 [Trichonephila clavipes]